jgi:hypothetical protein
MVLSSKDLNHTYQERAKRLGLDDAVERASLEKLLKQENEDPITRAKRCDPRERYQYNKEEPWFHDSALKCTCEKLEYEFLDRVCHSYPYDEQVVAEYEEKIRQNHNTVCGGGDICDGIKGCIPECPYYPDVGVQSHDGHIAYPGTEEFTRIMSEWELEKKKEKQEFAIGLSHFRT